MENNRVKELAGKLSIASNNIAGDKRLSKANYINVEFINKNKMNNPIVENQIVRILLAFAAYCEKNNIVGKALISDYKKFAKDYVEKNENKLDLFQQFDNNPTLKKLDNLKNP